MTDETQEALRERGREASRAIQAGFGGNRPARYFPTKDKRLPADWPRTSLDLAILGYSRFMRDCEAQIRDRARREIADSREGNRRLFLGLIQVALKHETNPHVIAGLKQELRAVQRAVGIKPSAETVRQQTRDRVKRHRDRKRSRAAETAQRRLRERP
jgi:hypothetical protein